MSEFSDHEMRALWLAWHNGLVYPADYHLDAAYLAYELRARAAEVRQTNDHIMDLGDEGSLRPAPTMRK